MKISRVWIIEIWNEYKKQWEPTIGTGLSRYEARMFKRDDWEYNNPADKFRIKCYRREG